MRIPVTSNIISAIYFIIFDFWIHLSVTLLGRFFLSAWNVRLIYERRQKVPLTSSRFSILADQGLTTTGVGRCTALTSGAIIVLAIAGSFSINGVSKQVTRVEKFAVVVDRATSDNIIDFREHISADGKVSATALLVRDAMFCVMSDERKQVLYSAVNSLEGDLKAVKWPKVMTLKNSSCRTKRYGFKEKVALSHLRHFDPLPEKCVTFRVRLDPDPKLERAFRTASCPFEILETYCFILHSSETVHCVGLIKGRRGYRLLHGESSAISASGGNTSAELKFSSSSLTSETRIPSRSLPSAAILTAAGARIARAHEASMLSIRRDEYVERPDGSVNETEINLKLLAATLGTALILLALFSVITVWTWWLYVVRRGRQKYNRFHTPGDILSCLVCEVINDGRCKLLRDEGVEVWVKDGKLRVSALSKDRL